ncbi:MAG: C4-dicarboxylate ABC transporter permease [Rhodobacterales bacterium]|nr:MAG: C4-dicarboxylate ABC transporter permease [Rhodobacterales bacterium]
MLVSVSSFWAKMEIRAAAVLAAAITALILLNVVTRSLGAALYWVDELAIYAMVWMTFLGASASVHYGNAVTITVLTSALSRRAASVVAKLVDLTLLVISLFLLWFCWRWFNPLELARHGFDVAAFQGATFNFIYAEPTSTLGLPKVWVWLVLWLFAFGLTLHSVTNVIHGPQPRKVPA